MNIGTSIRKLMNLFIILFVALSGGLVYWQVIVAQQVTANVHNSRICQLENAPLRGTIYDRNGIWLARSVPDTTAQCGYRREYSDPSLAGLIGYYAGSNYPETGLEKQFDDILSGRTGLTMLSNTVNHLLHTAPVGDDIYLTIDDRIQQIADQRFSDPYYNGSLGGDEYIYPSDAGVVIVSNPHTGEMLAMLSRPSYDPNKLVQTLQRGDLSYYNQLLSDPEQPLIERPLKGNYVPGSVFKTVTLMAGIDAGKTTLDQPWNATQARGPVYFDGHPIGPDGNNIGNTSHFPVTTEYGYTYSDNVIFAEIGVNTGFDAWMNYVKSFYVGQQIPFDLPVNVSTVLPAGQQQMSSLELASDAFGQGTDFVTPLQMSLIDNIVANNGQLMRPTLIYKITDHDGNPIQTFNPQLLSTPIKSDTAVAVRQAMYGVIQCGPGSIVHVNMNRSPWSIIGKTGTAQLAGSANPHGWMITEAPYSLDNPDQLPALTVVAMREHGGNGAGAVGPMIADIYNDVFSNGYVQASKPPVLGSSYCYNRGLVLYL